MTDNPQLGRIDYIVHSGGALKGRIRVPGDKSISHRAIMLGSLAEGQTKIDGFLEGEDCLATMSAFRKMGVDITSGGDGSVTIEGVGLHGLQPPSSPLDLGNSGTSMRLMAGILAGQSFDSELVGDASLSKRPMRRIIDPLGEMGAQIESGPGMTPPLRIHGKRSLRAIHYQMPVASAQVKSSVLLAGLYAKGETCVREPGMTRDHTERMLMGFQYPVRCDDGTVCLRGGDSILHSCSLTIPADLSSAAFFMVGASIAEDSDVILTGVGMNPTRRGVVDILRLMGGDIEIEGYHEVSGEPVADLRVRTARLHGIEIPKSMVPLAIDEFPAVFIAAAMAEGVTVLRGAEELRVKESDRILMMAQGLERLGVRTEVLEDGLVVHGTSHFSDGEVDTGGDHRIAMAFAMAGLRSRGEIRIANCVNVETSFPGFADLAAQAGLNLDVSHV